MTKIPKVENYDINILVALGEQTDNIITYNKIKLLIIEKVLSCNMLMFVLVNSFRFATGILREAYAEAIAIRMTECNYSIDDITLNDIVSLLSLDALMYYGAESLSENFREKSIQEFWKRAIFIEDKNELFEKSPKYKNKLIRNLTKKER